MEDWMSKLGGRKERIVKSREDWRKQNQVKKLRIFMTIVGVAIVLSAAAGALLAWFQVNRLTSRAESRASSIAPVSSEASSLPVYDNSLNLLVVNSENPIPSDYRAEVTEYGGVSVDGRIVPALEEMMQGASSAGCPLKLTAGYVDTAKQDELYRAEVKRLMKTEKKSQVLAENEAQATVGRGGYNESQTGLSVVLAAQDGAGSTKFTSTKQYQWLLSNSVNYGFILRYPEHKEDLTGMQFQPGRFRYVGKDNAVKMRELSMCLEEYSNYVGVREEG
jgi:D-alanyl-D-alanine carboxypeptidase